MTMTTPRCPKCESFDVTHQRVSLYDNGQLTGVEWYFYCDCRPLHRLPLPVALGLQPDAGEEPREWVERLLSEWIVKTDLDTIKVWEYRHSPDFVSEAWLESNGMVRLTAYGLTPHGNHLNIEVDNPANWPLIAAAILRFGAGPGGA